MTELAENENPYWHSEGQPHPIDLNSIRQTCFELYNIFAASAALASHFEFTDDDQGDPEYSSLRNLHHEYAEARACELLLMLATLVRTYDDIMSAPEPAAGYIEHSEQTSGINCIGTLDTGPLSLREACNKVIHAEVVRPIYDSVEREVDEDTFERVWHLRGEIEFSGTLGKKHWEAVLYVPPFLEVILDRIAFGWRTEPSP